MIIYTIPYSLTMFQKYRRVLQPAESTLPTLGGTLWSKTEENTDKIVI